MRHILLALCLVAGLAGTASADVKSGVKAYLPGHSPKTLAEPEGELRRVLGAGLRAPV